MKVRVRWLGFHDDSWHDSDVFETEKEVKDFINQLGSPEDQSAFLVDEHGEKQIPFYEFYSNQKEDNNEVK